jgi:hypothetical protein
MLYVEGAAVRWQPGALLQSPPLPAGQTCTVRLRAVYGVADRVLVEDKPVELLAGRTTPVTFDGRGALSFPTPGNAPTRAGPPAK